MKELYTIYNQITGETTETTKREVYNEIIEGIINDNKEVQYGLDEVTTTYSPITISTHKYFDEGTFKVKTYIYIKEVK